MSAAATPSAYCTASAAGRTFLISVPQLREALEAVSAGEPYAFESQRRARVADTIVGAAQEARTRAVKLHVRPSAGVGLPEAVRLRPGELHVAFSTAEELLGYLYGIVQMAAEDFEGFKNTVEVRVAGRVQRY